MTAIRRACSDADDNVGTVARRSQRNCAREIEVASIDELKILQIDDGRIVIRRTGGPFIDYLSAAPGRSDVALMGLDVARRLVDAERRAEQAERRVQDSRLTSAVLAIAAERVDAAEARARDLDTALEAMAVERQRMQADIARLAEERDGAHEEATALLTRARNAERRCTYQDVELINRLARITSLEYSVEQARGQVEAERIKASASIRDIEYQRDREADRAAHAEAACRDATAALVKAEARIDEMTADVERARQCVRSGLSACSDEEVAEEFARRLTPTLVGFGTNKAGASARKSWVDGRWRCFDGSGFMIDEAQTCARVAILRAKRLAEGT